MVGSSLASPKGLKTEETVAVLDSISPLQQPILRFVTRTYWYDDRERVIQTLESHPDGTSLRTSFAYDLQGNVIARKETASAGTESHSLQTIYTYDSRGKVLNSQRTFDGQSLDGVDYAYDDLGVLSQKTVGDKICETYSHDLRGWQSGVAAAYNTSSYFNESLRYTNPTRSASVEQYNGNISEITTSHYGHNADTYCYSYDGLSRLTGAQHFTGRSLLSRNTNTEKNITYDLNGNIAGLTRYGEVQLDNEVLSMAYLGNRMTGVYSSEHGALLYGYDANGNRTSDGFSGLEFSYNLLNLPLEARNANGSMAARYTYLADGTKVRAVDNTGTGFLYVGSFVFCVSRWGVTLESVVWDEGRINLTNTLEIGASGMDASGSPELSCTNDEWFTKDHLGNVRAVVNLSCEADAEPEEYLLEQNDYLPFGTRAVGSNYISSTTNRWRYAGKEKQSIGSFDSGLLDFGARHYDTWACQWTAVDPMAEKYYGLTPYNFCVCSPVRYYDPTGTDGIDKIMGFVVGVLTNVVPVSTLRDAYSPTDSKDYNNALKEADALSQKAGAVMVTIGLVQETYGTYLEAGGSAFCLSVAGAPEGVAFATAGACTVAMGELEALAGAFMSANAERNASEGYDRGAVKPNTLNQSFPSQSIVPKGYYKTNYRSHGQVVYTNGKNYISRDIDQHNGGVWKMSDKPENFSKGRRMGTYDANLVRIGD